MLEICEDVGTCWDDLAIKLNLSAAAVRNIDADFRLSREKAREILHKWMEKQGDAATVGRLEVALLALEKKSIAQKLLGMWLLFSKEWIQKLLKTCEKLSHSQILARVFMNMNFYFRFAKGFSVYPICNGSLKW